MILFKIINKLNFIYLIFFIFFFYNNILFSKNLPLCEINKKSSKKIKNNLIYNNCFGEYIYNREYNHLEPLKYIGDWGNNLPHGKGMMIYSDLRSYDGMWKNGKRNGIGKMSFPKGYLLGEYNMSEYYGTFLNDQMSGRAKIILKSSKYNGEMKNDLMSGYGIMLYDNGDKYFGYWKNNHYFDFGIKIFKNKSKYAGNWNKNKFFGHGKFYYTNGNIYDGSWYRGERYGYGVLEYSNGKVIKGNFSNGLFGNGIYKITDIFYFFDAVYFWYNKIFSQ